MANYKTTLKIKCIKCGFNGSWNRDKITTDEFGFFYYPYKCGRCGYTYNVIDYITATKIDASLITVQNEPRDKTNSNSKKI